MNNRSCVAYKSRATLGAVSALFSLLLLFTASPAAGQDTLTGAFQGTVFSSVSGGYIGGAAVEITSETTGVVNRLVSDSNGRFYQGLLAPGWYTISVAYTAFKPRSLRREIKVSFTGEVVPVPVALEPEAPGVVTPVPAAAEPADDIRTQINTTDARRDGSFKTEELGVLPLGGVTITRSFDELALLIPGVAPAPQTIGDVAGPGVGPGVGSAGQFAVNGLRSRANNFTVDGSDNNDEDIGVRRQGFVALIPQPIESVQEFQIITLLAPAQFGRNMGGQVNAVSKGGGKKVHGALYGFFNSEKLNARNQFDSDDGDEAIALRTEAGQAVLLDAEPIEVSRETGGKESFTAVQAGAVLGGPVVANRAFYFVSGEYQKINANQEKSFAVPTIEQRGPFRTGATGTNTNFFTGAQLPNPLFPTNSRSDAVFSLFPFANDPNGVFGANTFTRVLPANGEGIILSGRIDNNFALSERPQTFTARYNFTDDQKDIPAVNEAIFSSVRSSIQTHNLSLFLNSQLSRISLSKIILNQVRFSVGRTKLNFEELRDTAFLIPSQRLPDVPFLLNTEARFNRTLPSAGQVNYSRIQPGASSPESAENVLGAVGQIVIAGFSPLGTDVYTFPQTRTNTTIQFADELKAALDKHKLIVGADVRLTRLDSNLPRLSRTLITFNGAPRLVPSGGSPCLAGGVGGFCFLPRSDPTAVLRPEDLAGLGAASNSLLTLNVDRPDSQADLRYNQLNFYAQDTWRLRPELSISFGLRYEYNSPIKEADGLIENSFSDARLGLLPVLQRLVGGRSALYESDLNNFGPRLGVAYSRNFFGSGRVTVFRGGYGLFYDQVLGAVANQSRNVFPTFVTVNFGGMQTNSAAQALSIFNPTRSTVAGVPVIVPGTANTFNTAGFNSIGVGLGDFVAAQGFPFPVAVDATLPAEILDMPMAHHFSFAVEQQLNSRFTVSVAYAGTVGRNLLRFTTPNLGAAHTVVPTDIRSISGSLPNVPSVRGMALAFPRPLDRTGTNGSPETLGAVNQFETTAESDYHSLQTELRGQIGTRLSLRMAYTFSKVTDEVSDVFDLAGAYVLPQNSMLLERERGPANFDVRHRWTYDVVYSFPEGDRGSFAWALVKDLQFAATGRFHSGQPFTVNSVIDINLDGNLTDRLNTLDGIEITGDRSQPLRLTASNPFTMLAPFGQDGAVGRNTFRAGHVLELDVSAIKKFRLGEHSLAIRADIFNMIDRANYGIPVRALEAPSFGRAISTVTPGRRIQLSLKYEF